MMTLIPYIVCALQEVYDPEVGMNIVDLGLIYHVEERQGHVRVRMTMTHRGCPLVNYITGMAEAVIRENVPGVRSVEVEVVWEPPWTPAMVSEEAKGRLVHR